MWITGRLSRQEPAEEKEMSRPIEYDSDGKVTSGHHRVAAMSWHQERAAGMHRMPDDIAGYTFNADIYCPDCIVGKVDPDSAARGIGKFAESALNKLAQDRGIDRDDERSYDSGEFPKVLFRDMLSTNDECVECGEPSDTHPDDHAFVDPSDRCGSCGAILGES